VTVPKAALIASWVGLQPRSSSGTKNGVQSVYIAAGADTPHRPVSSPVVRSAGTTVPLLVNPLQVARRLVPCTEPAPAGTAADTIALLLMMIWPANERNSFVPPLSPTVGE